MGGATLRIGRFCNTQGLRVRQHSGLVGGATPRIGGYSKIKVW